MKIDVQMKVDEDMNPDKSEVATGWVEIEDCIKFPVKVRRFTDKVDQKEKMFVSYPQKKKGDSYENVVYPHDKKVREELEGKVLDTVWSEVRKGIELPAVENVRVSLLQQKQADSSIVARGIATLKLAGMTINGILIKESEKGLFVQMPQYKADGAYKDTVYGTNTSIHALIKNEVLDAYKKELEQVPKGKYKEQPERKQEVQTESEQEMTLPKQADKGESLKDVIYALELGDKQRMQRALKNAEFKIGQPEFTANGKTVKYQSATLEEENLMVMLHFLNQYDPAQERVHDFLKQTVRVDAFDDGNLVGRQVLAEKESLSFEGAEKNYKDMLGSWKMLTKQENSFVKANQLEGQNMKHQREKLPTPRI